MTKIRIYVAGTPVDVEKNDDVEVLLNLIKEGRLPMLEVIKLGDLYVRVNGINAWHNVEE